MGRKWLLEIFCSAHRWMLSVWAGIRRLIWSVVSETHSLVCLWQLGGPADCKLLTCTYRETLMITNTRGKSQLAESGS